MTLLENIRVVDADTHLVEPPSLWSDRMASRWGDLIPHVRTEETGVEVWYVGDTRLLPVAATAYAGWKDFSPSYPPTFAEADPAAWDANARLKIMDDYGIDAAVLFPNLAVFTTKTLREVGDLALSNEYVRAYNDYQTDWCSADPKRLIPITALPIWDLEASLAEMERCAAQGHRGIIMAQRPEILGLPQLVDFRWDRLWSAAQDMQLPVNFHIADSGGGFEYGVERPPELGRRANFVSSAIPTYIENLKTVVNLIAAGICHRFPSLEFVSVESGAGWLPFALEALDWQWTTGGVHHEHPEYDLLPSEYFDRQIYGCFWFERGGLIDAVNRLGAHTLLYSTDFPHPTSMAPGPATTAPKPSQYIEEDLAPNLTPEALEKVLHGNAARLYRLGESRVT